MDNEFILYSYYRSSTAYRTRIALNLKGVKYQQHAVHLLEDGGQQHKPEYRALNPAGGVPTLVHNGNVLSQSFAIIEYINEIIPEPPFFPSIPLERAKVRQICEHINCEIHPIANLKVQQYLVHEFNFTEEQKTKWIQHWIKEGMDALEQLLSKTAGYHAHRDSVTVADIFVIPQVFSAKRFGLTLENYPTIARVNENAMKIPAFNQAHPHVQPDTPSELYRKV